MKMLSQHRNPKSTTSTSSKVNHGSRLRSTVGLNITEEEHVLLQLKHTDENKKQTKKPHPSRFSKPTRVSTNNKATRKGFNVNTTDMPLVLIDSFVIRTNIRIRSLHSVEMDLKVVFIICVVWVMSTVHLSILK